MELNAILRELTAAPGASGDEQQIRETAKRLLAPYGEVHFDKLGNVVCEVKGSGKRHVLLDAHMDQIGLAVLEITPEGFLRAAPRTSVCLPAKKSWYTAKNRCSA